MKGRTMSQMIVKAQRITEIKEHSNADKLEIACIGAWETCVKRDVFAKGDLVVFIPPDAILTESLHQYLGITQYCGEMPKSSEEAEQGKRRVRACRLRGVRSFGTLMTLNDVAEYHNITRDWNVLASDFAEGDELQNLLDITKYEPPEKVCQGDQAPANALFHKYTSIERYQNYPSLLKDGEEVVITEKIHGTNSRIGVVMTDDGPVTMCGSHNTCRKEIDTLGRTSLYWMPLTEGISGLKDMIEGEQSDRNAVSFIVFGEIYGPGVQDMCYGGNRAFRVFDISVNGNYLNWNDVEHLCDIYGVPTVPVLYKGPFSPKVLMDYTDGHTVVTEHVASGFAGREGVVVKPMVEREDFDVPDGRVILKSVSCMYLARKNPTDNA
jgi:RNA ligase (TIGR02306 family)